MDGMEKTECLRDFSLMMARVCVCSVNTAAATPPAHLNEIYVHLKRVKTT